jgi:G3E family GTPase
MSPSPLVLVTGFLGAGKTTFLKKLTPELEARGFSISVVINDYENAEIDASSLKKPGREVTAVSGSCVCCDSLLTLTLALLRMPVGGNHIALIEANGTSDPLPLIGHFLENPALRERFAPILQLTVIDATRWQNRGAHQALERLQVESASHLLLARGDEVTRDRIDEIRSAVGALNRLAEWTELDSFVDTIRNDTGLLPGTPSRYGAHHHDAHAFVGVHLDLPDLIPAAVLREWLLGLPLEVLRVKGVLRLAEIPEHWFHFQRLDGAPGEAALQALPQRPEFAPCAVLIGVRLNRDDLTQLRTATIGSPTRSDSP